VQHLPYYPTATHSRCERDGHEETGGRRGQEEAGGFWRENAFRCRKVKNEVTGRLNRAAQRAWERSGAERYRGSGSPRREYRVPHMRLVIEARHQGIEDEVKV
jgi:hypothetical protein